MVSICSRLPFQIGNLCRCFWCGILATLSCVSCIDVLMCIEYLLTWCILIWCDLLLQVFRRIIYIHPARASEHDIFSIISIHALLNIFNPRSVYRWSVAMCWEVSWYLSDMRSGVTPPSISTTSLCILLTFLYRTT